MVLEMPCPGLRYMFVASNLHNRHKAEQEILRWARGHDCRPRLETRLFVTFQPSRAHKDQARKEWHLLERKPH